MSGESIPYHLRPHKAVDRRLFVDLLAKCERWCSLTDAVYISMGAYPLEDHKLIHRVLGLRKLIAFDFEEEVVKRQIFNRPIDSCKCKHYSSDQVVSTLDQVLIDSGYDDASSIIIWLDYTSPSELGSQIREFASLLNKLNTNDIVRITVNATPAGLYTPPRMPGVRGMLEKDIRQERYAKLNERIGDFVPADVTPDMMVAERLPSVIGRAFGAAALQALPVTGKNTFAPLSLVHYADGQQMLSLTGIVVPRQDENTMRKSVGLSAWRFASDTWDDVHALTVPSLTTRERLYLERFVGTATDEEIRDGLGFDFAKLQTKDKFLKDYVHYYRFYPNLLAADV